MPPAPHPQTVGGLVFGYTLMLRTRDETHYYYSSVGFICILFAFRRNIILNRYTWVLSTHSLASDNASFRHDGKQYSRIIRDRSNIVFYTS